MDDREKIAYLLELAESHFTDGNLSAAIDTWQQVLQADRGNEAAQRGIVLAQRKQGPAAAAEAEGPFGPDAGGAGPFDGDATVMFSNPGAATPAPFDPPPPPPPARPAAAAAPPRAPAQQPSFDANSTMAFMPGQSQQGGAPPAFDPNLTMAFGGAPALAPPLPPPPAGGFDADSTISFESGQSGGLDFGLASAAPPGAWSGGSASDESDRTVLTNAPGGPPSSRVAEDVTILSPDPVPPRPPPPPIAPAPKAAAAASKALEDFDLPEGGLEMSGPPPKPPAFPSFGAPSVPGPTQPRPAAGFSFEMPPPPGPSGGAFDLPELPSVGLPPPPPPPAPPPPPPASRKSAASANFGDVDPGEIEGLAVPVVTTQSEAAEEGSGESQAEREARLKADYALQFGRTPVSSSSALPLPATAKSGVNWKLMVGILGVFALGLGVTYLVFRHLNAPTPPPPPVVAKPVEKTPEQLKSVYFKAVEAAKAAVDARKFDDAVKEVAKGREAARESGLAATPELDAIAQTLEFEAAWQVKFDRALRDFCMENYADARKAFEQLEQAKPGDPRAGEFIQRLWYNAGVLQLQMKQPWEAPFYFEQVLARNPVDAEAKAQHAFASRFKPGDRLDSNYSFAVDSLDARTAGCK